MSSLESIFYREGISVYFFKRVVVKYIYYTNLKNI